MAGDDNLVRYQDENGAVTRLEYFGLGEIKRRRQPDGESVEYHYDAPAEPGEDNIRVHLFREY